MMVGASGGLVTRGMRYNLAKSLPVYIAVPQWVSIILVECGCVEDSFDIAAWTK